MKFYFSAQYIRQNKANDGISYNARIDKGKVYRIETNRQQRGQAAC